MIKKEFYKTREDGVKLYLTYSDTDHLIKGKNGFVYGEAIDINEDEPYEEVEEYIELQGPDNYEELLEANETLNAQKEGVTRKINHLNLTNSEALSLKDLYPRWESKIGKTIEQGFITLYGGNLWRARQTHTALEIYPPSLNTASLYEVIEKEHEGTLEDPIPYMPPMEIFEGKYYVEEEETYKCTRSSSTAITHPLSALVGLYVEIV